MKESFKANQLVDIVPKWYLSRISADCQQNLFPSEHGAARILLETFLGGQR